MKEVFLVARSEKTKAEDLLKKDDAISRGSINIKDPASLDMKEDGIFIILDNSDEAIKKAEDLLKGIGEKYGKKDEVLRKVKEQEDAATEGFGNILG